MTKLSDLKGVGPKKEAAFKDSGILTLTDLVHYLPRKYQDRTHFKKIRDVRSDEEVHLVAAVDSVETSGYARNQRLLVTVSDETGSLNLTYFHGAFFWKKKFRPGLRMQIWGTAKYYGGLQIAHPDIKILKGDEVPTGSIIPLYSISEVMATARIDHGFIQKAVKGALAEINLKEFADTEMETQTELAPLQQSITHLHFPTSFVQIENAYMDLKFRELWPLCRHLEESRLKRVGQGTRYKDSSDLQKKVRKNLPFELTRGQNTVVTQIGKELASADQLNGLLQGDVGSGKTVAAILAAARVVGDGFQVAVLLPTEILAVQQFETFKGMFSGISRQEKPIRLNLLLGSTPAAERNKIKKDLESGGLDLIVGTHVLYSPDIRYKKLGFIVIDEQHRFGVEQRNAMAAKGRHPDVLYMTATPIPRTLTRSLYGDFTHFLLREKPEFQKPVSTRLVPFTRRASMYQFLKDEVIKGNQIFWVVPRISEVTEVDPLGLDNGVKPEADTLQSLEKIFREVKKSHSWKVSQVHGRMASGLKEKALIDFKNRTADILVATTVIEVGVDVPNANIIIIENPDRFGLAQLHQIRGRVGRGVSEAWCFLALPESPYPEPTLDKLKTFSESHDGFAIAEMDLDYRGSGDIEGLYQSGFGHLKFTNLIKDNELVQEVQQKVAAFMSKKKKAK